MYIEDSFDRIPDLMVFIRELLTGVENKSVVIYTHCEVRKQNEQSTCIYINTESVLREPPFCMQR